jgi:hypothetical protein
VIGLQKARIEPLENRLGRARRIIRGTLLAVVEPRSAADNGRETVAMIETPQIAKFSGSQNVSLHVRALTAEADDMSHISHLTITLGCGLSALFCRDETPIERAAIHPWI